ncbi:MAG: MliC family protein [Sutterellaceae bacterium]|nr:MliC family protein [Burkholderiaceae bacterium]MDW8429912.1 MliC family protein [Sutterellaceae bacterium]
MCAVVRLLASLLSLFAAAAAADTRVGKHRALTHEWHCDNGRVVLINFHPRRPQEDAWLTYLGNRVPVTRQAAGAGIAYVSADGRVRWFERGEEGSLQFGGLLDAPLPCQRRTNR